MADESDAEPGARTADPRLERVATIIRNGLSNGPISQSAAAWAQLETRLGDIAAAILKDL